MAFDVNNIQIREASLGDFDCIVNNERSCYEVPWSLQSLEACFTDGYSFWVMQNQQQVIGHMIVQWVVDEAHLHNVCVIPQFQSLGLGKQWMSHLIKSTRLNSCSVIFLEVRKSNNAAIELYSKLGFRLIGERKNYYQTKRGKEDGLVMELLTPA